MGFNSAFKGLKLLKTPGNGRLNNLNDPVLNVLKVQYHSLQLLEVKMYGVVPLYDWTVQCLPVGMSAC